MSNLETAGFVSPQFKPVSDELERVMRHTIQGTAAMCGAEAHVEFKTGETQFEYDEDLGFERAFFTSLPKEHPDAVTEIVTRLYRNKL